MAFNWDKLCKAQRDYPRPKFALDAVGKLLKKRPTDPYLLAWKASTLLRLDRRADEALSLWTSLCQQQPPITDLDLLPFIYNGVLTASRQINPSVSTPSSVGAEGLKAWQNAAKSLSNRRAKLTLWSDLFIVAMKEECWEDARLATMQANKEGIDPKYRKALYYSLILAYQLAGERKAEVLRKTGKIDQGVQIQLTLAQRQMKDAYGNASKSTDESIQVATMSDVRFMAAIYERQNRCGELFQLWDDPPPAVRKLIDGASWDFALLGIEVAHRQKEWQLVETRCYQLIEKIWQPGNLTADDPSVVKVNMFNICTMCWTMWKSLLNATTGLYPSAEGRLKIEKLYSGVWNSLPPLDPRTYRAIGLTQLMLESYLGHSILDTITQFYIICFRNPSCFKDLHRFVALLSVEEQRTFQSSISEHAQNLGTMMKDNEEISSEDIKQNIRVWYEAETTVLKFELLMIVSSPENPGLAVLENFVENTLRLWRLQLAVEATDVVCGSDAFLLAVEGLVHLFEATSLPQYLYQAAVLTRHAISLDRQQYGRGLALLSTRLHLRLGLGTIAFEHYNRVQVKEMLHDNVAWVPLSRISQSHPFGASGPRGFSADNELEKVISTLSRMENKVDDLLYADLQHFMYDKAFDLLELKRKLRGSLTKHFCIIERRRIARLAGTPVDTTLDLPLRNYEDISDNCHWDAVPALNNTRPDGLRSTDLISPITKLWVHSFHSLIDVVNGIVFKEFPTGHQVFFSCEPFTQISDSSTTEIEEPDNGARLSKTETGLNEFYWKPIACILQKIFPAEKLPVRSETGSLEEAFQHIFSQLEIDAGELQPSLLDDDQADFIGAPNLTEDGLNAVYGRLEVLRTLNRLLDFMRPISKARTHALHKDITVARCDLLHEYITEFYRLHRTRIAAFIDRLRVSGGAHIRALLTYNKTGAAVSGVIAGETLDRYSKEYADSATEALKGVLKVNLG
ncbi:hypothetical protein PMIN01_11675 [Paraphaeosphaeria minitans]|uniref:Uncharacterized protein n=1 Tax=Paraphaeosphaeria minitans TaxID=565426 RepID=A0A9P6G7Z2_9PLEO|nr:hypothetical protein PMIN01_11675 [Paraphaeosphaeria minitans]